jgi:hypothetical protein
MRQSSVFGSDDHPSHAGLGLTADVKRMGDVTFAVGGRVQLNTADATRFNGTGKSADVTGWGWIGATLLLGRQGGRR